MLFTEQFQKIETVAVYAEDVLAFVPAGGDVRAPVPGANEDPDWSMTIILPLGNFNRHSSPDARASHALQCLTPRWDPGGPRFTLAAHPLFPVNRSIGNEIFFSIDRNLPGGISLSILSHKWLHHIQRIRQKLHPPLDSRRHWLFTYREMFLDRAVANEKPRPEAP